MLVLEVNSVSQPKGLWPGMVFLPCSLYADYDT